jgi:hypothetical protein
MSLATPLTNYHPYVRRAVRTATACSQKPNTCIIHPECSFTGTETLHNVLKGQLIASSVGETLFHVRHYAALWSAVMLIAHAFQTAAEVHTRQYNRRQERKGERPHTRRPYSPAAAHEYQYTPAPVPVRRLYQGILEYTRCHAL